MQSPQVLTVVLPTHDLCRRHPVDRHLCRVDLVIAVFMRRIGQYGWLLTLAISIGLPV